MDATNFKHLIINDVGGVAVVSFINAQLIYESASVDEIGSELNSLISDHGHSKIVLDFSNVQYLSSMMLAKLASLDRNLALAKGRLAICGLGPILMDTIRMAHFERVFSIYENVGSAIQSF
jgi:anti-anti-sigma factor